MMNVSFLPLTELDLPTRLTQRKDFIHFSFFGFHRKPGSLRWQTCKCVRYKIRYSNIFHWMFRHKSGTSLVLGYETNSKWEISCWIISNLIAYSLLYSWVLSLCTVVVIINMQHFTQDSLLLLICACMNEMILDVRTLSSILCVCSVSTSLR